MQETLSNPFELQKLNMRSIFNLPEIPAAAEIAGAKPGLPDVPKKDVLYEHEMDRLRDMTIAWLGGFKAVKLEGNPSAGKDSLVTQWHACLNWPLYVVPGSPDLAKIDLIGQLLPTPDGTLKWFDGPVLKACRTGASCLISEYNTIDPGIATGLNLLLEGYSWTIPETGETIEPKATTRFFVTQNPEDSRASVAGRNVQDVANDDRFFNIKLDYLPAEKEKALVLRHLKAGALPPEVSPELFAKVVVEVANKTRESYADGVDEIDKPISTRSAIRWAKAAVMYTPVMKSQRISGIHYALPRAVKMNDAMAEAVKQLVTATMGYDENLHEKTVS